MINEPQGERSDITSTEGKEVWWRKICGTQTKERAVAQDTISEEFSTEVRKASELLAFLMSEGYPYHIPDHIIDEIEAARELALGHPSKEDRAKLTKAYRDLVSIPQNSVTFDRMPPPIFWSMGSPWLRVFLLIGIIPSIVSLSVLALIKSKYWYLPIIYAVLSLAGFFGFYVFTGVVSNSKLDKIIKFCYVFTIVALAMSILPFWSPNLFSQLSLEAPLGVLRGCASGISTDIPAEVQCKGTNDNYQWVINVGGVVESRPGEKSGTPQPSPGGESAAQQSPPGEKSAAQLSGSGGGAAAPEELGHQIRGGVVVPLYVIVFALIGSAVSMTRRVPEYQGRAMSSQDPLTNVQAREYLVFQIMQVLSAPMIAITVYYIIKPGTLMTSVVLGFGSGFASEPILLMIRGLVEKLSPAKAAESSPITVRVNPASKTLEPNQAQQFSSQVLGSPNSDVTWQLDPADVSTGTISQSGYYVAPSSPPAKTVTITAFSAADRTKSGSATVTVIKLNGRPDRPSGDAPPSLAGQSEDAILAQIGDKLAKLVPPAIERGKATDRDAVLAAMEALENRDQRFRGLGYTGWLRLLSQLTGE
jgi:hypothetical protein